MQVTLKLWPNLLDHYISGRVYDSFEEAVSASTSCIVFLHGGCAAPLGPCKRGTKSEADKDCYEPFESCLKKANLPELFFCDPQNLDEEDQSNTNLWQRSYGNKCLTRSLSGWFVSRQFAHGFAIIVQTVNLQTTAYSNVMFKRKSMESLDLKDYICELLIAHNIPFHTENEWIVPYGELPAIRSTWFQKETSGVFEVEVLLDGGRIINECFAGFGVGKQGILNGLENFCVNSFHVLLSAFWKRHEPEQVEIENWLVNGVNYKAYIGNLGTRATEGVKAKIPDGFFKALEETIKIESLNFDVSWFRVFFASVSGEFTFEALKDNEVWQNGIAMLSSQPWEKLEGYYSVRNFIVLHKAS